MRLKVAFRRSRKSMRCSFNRAGRGENDEYGDQYGEYENDDVLELVVEAEQAKAPLRLSKLLFDAQDRSSPFSGD
jgi:hypothetical protein